MVTKLNNPTAGEYTKLMQTNVDAQPEDVEIVKPPIHSIQNNIQTLRAIAIWFVLLFHMWPTRIKQGYLGVDIFFVISGYLMCLILSRKRPINLSVCVEFYYRRVKRIVPLYFTVILIVLVALRHVISPIEFTQLYEEAIPALGFYSNIPNVREAAYFDISSEHYYFLHSWSLSVELQFYLIIPLIFAFLDQIEKFRWSLRLTLIAVIPIASFLFQCYASKDFAHMLLPARIWQFFVGFGVFYLRAQRFFDLSKETSFDANKWIDSVKIVVVHMLLVLLLVFSLPIVSQLQRLFVVLLTGAVVGSHCETSVLSNLRPVITLGDISYSVYLIHWPLYTWHRYAHSEIYTDGGESSLITGLHLIAISIGVGYVIENVFKWLMKRLSDWRALTLLLCILLCLNGIQLHDVRNSAVDLDAGISANKPLDEAKQQIRRDIEMLWTTRANPPNFTKEEVLKYNAEQIESVIGSLYCDNQDRSLPTNYPLNMSSFEKLAPTAVYTCHIKGNGTKNIVVIGNSHAFFNLPGIAQIFRQTYKRLTLFGRGWCWPTSSKFQATYPSKPEIDDRLKLINATAPALKAWKYPIDIIIALYAMVGHPEIPILFPIETDELYKDLSSFYTEIATIPREALIMMESFPSYTKTTLINVVEAQMKSGNPLNTIGDPAETVRHEMAAINIRMKHIKCPKCLKLDLISFWCNRTHDNFCHSTDPQGIILFVDNHHPSGSFYNADFIYWLYRKFVV
ncbi:hypothetical protein M3Y98_00055200 [Aphelenchoides besseyi]|nr:hypothetical protein M3Y98_00055200 [Aphelenchoides besseyi]